ncbi:MAG TPA: holo-ACP synthase [Anaerolineales bacterium]|nr:holo-ACP synthase [Anaerolineales bacterium]HRF48320.1 holo-ACP synthase [Anaerolineales bacterium]
MLRTGIDLIEVSRIEAAIARHGERFLGRIFTPTEREAAGARSASLAARFAAKEAAAKALGTGLGEIAWREIEVVNDANRAPSLVLRGAAAERFEALGGAEIAVSLSHSQGFAVAVVVIT